MGGSAGDKSKSKTSNVALPSPEAIAAWREAADVASGIAGVQKNLPYVNELATSPAYLQSLNDTANTWSGWMGHAPVDVTAGMPPVTQGRYGSVIDYGAELNNMLAQASPDIQAMMARWVGPGLITEGSPYTPLQYDPYLNQKKVLKKNKKKGISTAGIKTPIPTYGGGSYT